MWRTRKQEDVAWARPGALGDCILLQALPPMSCVTGGQSPWISVSLLQEQDDVKSSLPLNDVCLKGESLRFFAAAYVLCPVPLKAYQGSLLLF